MKENIKKDRITRTCWQFVRVTSTWRHARWWDMTRHSLFNTNGDIRIMNEWIYTYQTFADAYLSVDYSCRTTSELHASAPFCALVTRDSIDDWLHLLHRWIDPRFCQSQSQTSHDNTSRGRNATPPDRVRDVRMRIARRTPPCHLKSQRWPIISRHERAI